MEKQHAFDLRFTLAQFSCELTPMARQIEQLHPNQVLQAAQDLKTKRLFPVHSGKFALSNHAWFDPLTIISELNKEQNIPLITPKIGEKVLLNNENQTFEKWWKTI